MTYEEALAYLERVVAYHGYNSEDSYEEYDQKGLEIAELLRGMRAENERLQKTLNNIATHNAPRTAHVRYRVDQKPSKNDYCWHGKPMWDDCVLCVAVYAKDMLEEKK